MVQNSETRWRSDNFDADYCAAMEEDEEIELPDNHAHKLVPEFLTLENEAITMEIGAYQQPRPQWDVQLLVEAEPVSFQAL